MASCSRSRQSPAHASGRSSRARAEAGGSENGRRRSKAILATRTRRETQGPDMLVGPSCGCDRAARAASPPPLAGSMGVKRKTIVTAFACALLLVAASAARAVEIVGTPGDDTLQGTPEPDQLYGDDGNDHLYGYAGSDYLEGGPGADMIAAGVGDDLVIGGTGADTIAGNQGRDTVYAGAGNDLVFGGQRDDFLLGQVGDDGVFGGAGDDVIYGGSGNDYIDAGSGADRIYAGAGDDRINVRDRERDVVDCGPGSDVVRADRFDVLRGCERRLKRRETFPPSAAAGARRRPRARRSPSHPYPDAADAG